MFTQRRYKLLTEKVINASQSSVDPEIQLNRIASVLTWGTNADLCLFRIQTDHPDANLIQGEAGDRSLLLHGSDFETSLRRVMSAGSPVSWDRLKEDTTPLAGSSLSSALIYPITWYRRPVALIVLGFRDRAIISARVTRTVSALARTLATLVRGIITRRYQIRKNEAAGELLRISEQLSLSPDVRDCFSQIVRAACDLTGARGSVLRVLDKGSLKVQSFFATDLSVLDSIEIPNDQAAAERAFKENRSQFERIADPDPVRSGGPAQHSLLCVPFSNHTGIAGVLTLMDRMQSGVSVPFGRLEREIARSLVRVGVMAVYHIRRESEVRKISRSLEARVKELTLLHQISRAVLDRKEVRAVLRSLLEAVTNFERFGFDRAFLFLHDGEERTIKGLLGVEAFPIEAEGNAERATPVGVRHVNLDELVKGYSMDLEKKDGVVQRTVLEKRSFRVKLPGDRDLAAADVVKHLGNVNSFATVPLVSEDRVLGVIWVDNLRTMRPIGHEDFQMLVSAAAQAGLAVERSFQAEALELLNSKMLDLQNRMIQWEKMAALGEMAASVAHDIRNPLVSIGGFARRLKKLLMENAQGLGYVDIIVQEVDRLERTLDNVMSYSRSYGLVEKKTVPLFNLLSECAELFRENFKKKRVALQRQFGKDLPELTLDERQIKQAVLNVLFNAGEAVDRDGVVGFDAQFHEEDSFVVVSISDGGGGIKEDVLDRIFEPFYTTKGTGTGLGLAIAQRAVAGHGGEIRVDNRQGEGVTFTICLPLSGQRFQDAK